MHGKNQRYTWKQTTSFPSQGFLPGHATRFFTQLQLLQKCQVSFSFWFSLSPTSRPSRLYTTCVQLIYRPHRRFLRVIRFMSLARFLLVIWILERASPLPFVVFRLVPGSLRGCLVLLSAFVSLCLSFSLQVLLEMNVMLRGWFGQNSLPISLPLFLSLVSFSLSISVTASNIICVYTYVYIYIYICLSIYLYICYLLTPYIICTCKPQSGRRIGVGSIILRGSIVGRCSKPTILIQLEDK